METDTLYGRAHQVFETLKRGGYIHGGPDSLGIPVDAEEVVLELAKLAKTTPSETAFTILTDTAALICALTLKENHQHAYVVIKRGGGDEFYVDIRADQPLPAEGLEEVSHRDLMMIVRRRSGLEIMIQPEGTVFLEAHSHFVQDRTEKEFTDHINHAISALKPTESRVLARGFLDAIEPPLFAAAAND